MKSMRMRSTKLFSLACLVMLGGCGLAATPPVSVTMKPAEDKPAADSAEAPAATGTDAAPAESTAGGVGDFSGSVLLAGDGPALPPLVAMGQTVPDKETCSAMEVPNESILVDSATKGIQNVFVYLEKAPAGAAPIAPPEKQIFDQKGCRFIPHSMIVRTKQPLMVLSDDDVAHNTHTFPSRNATFNSVIGKKERKGVPVLYGQSEKEPIEVKCDYHPWMKAYHLPLDHGYAALSNEKGEFSIQGLPAGNYTFKVWHEAAGPLERAYKVSIKGGTNTPVKLEYPLSKFSK